MKIKFLEIQKGPNFDHCFQADCLDCPGMPPVGYGKTKEEALAALFYRMMFDNTGGRHSRLWIDYIKLGEPIIIDDKLWEDPCKCKR